MESLVTALAVKIGQATDRILPLAQEVVRQYSGKFFWAGIILLTMFGIFVPIFLFLIKKAYKSRSTDTILIVYIVGGVALFLCLGLGIDFLLTGIYPLADLMYIAK